MKKYSATFLLVVIISTLAFSQISKKGTPPSFKAELKSELNNEVPLLIMPAIDIDKLLSEDAINNLQKDIPWRFGENLFVDVSLYNSGVWSMMKDGSKVWRLRIKSTGAYSINLTFNKFHLPANAELYIYNTNHSDVLGAFTEQNNQTDNFFATQLIQGDEITLEYYEPKDVSFAGEMNLWRVTHAYRDVFAYAKSFGASGSCNKNVACPEAAGWENEVRSVCMLVVNGGGFCSGALVNNTSNDGTPYILTANHCSASNDFASWVFWFNWQSSTCDNPGASPTHNQVTTSGSVLKARNSGSDFCLVKMNATPPNSFNTYYAGWDHSGTPSTNSVCIHHPEADIKKITFDNDPPTAVDWGSPSAACWQIGSWDLGTTEPGSSGSPLFSNNHRIIGQLFGGSASCTSLTSDNFGRFAVSWDGTDSTMRLKDWLDPLNSGVSNLPGFDPTASISPEPKGNNQNIILYPNPVNDILHIDISAFTGNVTIQIINSLGQQCRSDLINSFSQSIVDINIVDLQEGFYIVKVGNRFKINTEKLLIEKH
ncbi:MAG: T9SS type A sorting domain-containing protein [Bacteroidota bacterium]